MGKQSHILINQPMEKGYLCSRDESSIFAGCKQLPFFHGVPGARLLGLVPGGIPVPGADMFGSGKRGKAYGC